MIPHDYQTELANKGFEILKENMIVYLAMEERTGKTLTSILIAEQANVKKVLVITKKKALTGWKETLDAFAHAKDYTVTNYHQASKFVNEYDLVILDESHNYLSAYPKHSTLWRSVKKLTIGKPIIFISATPYAQGPQQLFGQFALSSWSPWHKYNNYYRWFAAYGKAYTVSINGINIPQYDRVHNDKVVECVEDLFITRTRQELGFEHEPEDEVIYITLDDETKITYNLLLEHGIVDADFGELVCDTTSKLRTVLHQLEGGTVKLTNEYAVLPNQEKIDAIKDRFGDSESLVIMYNYKAEEAKLKEHFKKAALLQATSYAEGVDLHAYETLVVYSQDFSTARHTQRRARQCNLKRNKPITVYYLLVKKAISEQVYKTVSLNKKNFVDSVFDRNKL